jgi:hypothetical protein
VRRALGLIDWLPTFLPAVLLLALAIGTTAPTQLTIDF